MKDQQALNMSNSDRFFKINKNNGEKNNIFPVFYEFCVLFNRKACIMRREY